AFLDDAPLEERRARAVYARRATEPSFSEDLGALDAAAIERVCDEARPDPRDADELHDALLTAGFLTPDDLAVDAFDFFERTIEVGGADRLMWRRCSDMQASGEHGGSKDPHHNSGVWVAAERLPEM